VQRLFHVEVGHCTVCGKRAQGRHPLQTSDALGAAAVQIGPEAQALTAELRTMGLSHQKAARVLEIGYGLDVERSTVCRALSRVATKMRPTYTALVEVVRQSPVVWMDETGWRWAATLAWAWLAATKNVVVYSIQRGRGFAHAAALLGENFAGTLHHDGLRLYYGFLRALHQSCIAHLLRRSKAMIEAAGPRGENCFAARVLALLLHALAVRARYERGEITLHGMRVIAGQLFEHRLHPLLLERPQTPEDTRLANHLAHESPSLFTFLRDPEVEPTNNWAELWMRPMVINRKTWGGNRTDTGVFVQETLASVLTTFHVQHEDPFSSLVSLQRSPTPFVLGQIIPDPLDSS
jgi:transposase